MNYDIALIGLGASNSLLLLELHERGLLQDLDVLILESESKWKNDKTYCFWGRIVKIPFSPPCAPYY
jgi:hypothetical protein